MKPTFDLTDKVPLKKVSLLLFVPGNSQVFYSTDISNIKPLSQENRFPRRIRTEIEKKSGGKIRIAYARGASFINQTQGAYELPNRWTIQIGYRSNRTTEKGYI